MGNFTNGIIIGIVICCILLGAWLLANYQNQEYKEHQQKIISQLDCKYGVYKYEKYIIDMCNVTRGCYPSAKQTHYKYICYSGDTFRQYLEDN